MLLIFDKLLFAGVLLLLFQAPILATQFGQFINGYYTASAEQIEAFRANAQRNGYPSLQAMIDTHLVNDLPSVRDDAKQKQDALEQFEHLAQAQAIFSDEQNLPEQLLFMASPSSWPLLQPVLQRFSPGIPLHPTYLGSALITALFLSHVICWPFRRRKVRQTARFT